MILRTYLLLLVMFKYKQRDYMKSESLMAWLLLEYHRPKSKLKKYKKSTSMRGRKIYTRIRGVSMTEWNETV